MKALLIAWMLGTAQAPVHDIEATVVYVIDGDTIVVEYEHTPIYVRLAHIDTPETRHPKCNREYALGMLAKEYLQRRLAPGTQVLLLALGRKDKYDRFLATVMNAGEDINQALLNMQLARPYEGGHKSSWCN